MIDALYSNRDLVNLYDRLNASDHDRRFYLAEIGQAPQSIIDLGSGTGLFAMSMAEKGFKMLGVEPAPAMFAYAREQDKENRVCWINGDAQSIPDEYCADVVVMMGHAFQCLLTDEDVKMTLRKVRTVLRSGGRFMFESRNPLVKPWERWDEILPPVCLCETRNQLLTVAHHIIDVHSEHVTFETNYSWDNKKYTSKSTLRFMSRSHIESHMHLAGFNMVNCFGNWDRSPFLEESPEIIIIAK